MVLKMSASSFITQLPPTPDCSPSPLPLMDCVPLVRPGHRKHCRSSGSSQLPHGENTQCPSGTSTCR